ncbi:MAG: YkgJ family cysteine cluster protein [Planctomycetes bacterium]|nr:YkgJ family cysteine cluster protein [Planctomycetota bacterium]
MSSAKGRGESMAVEESQEKLVYDLELKVGEERLKVQARIPRGPVRIADVLPVFQVLDNITVDVGADAACDRGKTISCREGCGACCRQPVPVSWSETRYLVELIESMEEPRREHVKRRFCDALAALEERGLGRRLRSADEIAETEAKRAFGLEYFRCGIPCPFLEEESCSIHIHRPLACREYLVTSSAEACRDPGPGKIEFVPLPVHMSRILFRFDDGRGDGPARWLPLVRILEWAEQNPEAGQERFAGPQLFESFLERFAASMQKAEKAPSKET